MKNMILMTVVALGLTATAQANESLKCAANTETILACSDVSEDGFVQSLVICQDAAGDYTTQMLVAGGDLTPAMAVELTARTGASTYAGSEDGVSINLSVSSRPLKGQDGSTYRPAKLILDVDGDKAVSEMACNRSN